MPHAASRPLLTLALLTTTFACAHGPSVGRVRDLPIESASAREYPSWSEASVLIESFEDDRSSEYYRTMASSAIPIVNLIHSGATLEYPEHGGLASTKRQRYVRRVGGLERELPFLLARALPGDNALVEDELHDLAEDAPSFDYVVKGRVVQTSLTREESVVLGMVGLLGVPMVFSRQQFHVEIEVHRADGRRLMRRRIERDLRRAEGLYYNHDSTNELAIEAITESMEEAAQEVMLTIALDRARTPMGTDTVDG